MTSRVLQLYQRYRRSITLRAGSSYVFGNLFLKAITFIAFPIFANLLTPDEFGTVAVFSGWLSIFGVVITLNVASGITNAKFDYNSQEFKRYSSAILGLGLASSIVAFIVIALMSDEWIDDLFGLPRQLVLIAVTTAALYFPVQVAFNTWRANYSHKHYNVVNLLVTLYSIVLSLLFILIVGAFIPGFDRAGGRILGIAIVYGAAGVLILWRKLSAGRVLYNRDYWRYALTIALPLIPHVLSGILMSRFDQLLINQYVGRTETGIYSVAYRFGEMTNLLWISTNSVWLVWFFEQMKRGNTALIRRRAHQYLLAFSAMTVGLILAGPLLIRFLTPPTYWPASGVVPVVMLSGFFSLLYAFYASVEFYEKKTGYIAIATLLASVVNVVLNIWLIPRMGYQIAAWTTVVSYAVLFFVHSGIVIYRLNVRGLYNFWLIVGTGFVMLLLTIVVRTIA